MFQVFGRDGLFNRTVQTDMDNDDYESLPQEWPMATHMLAGAAAGILEHATMYPVDCVKTQMQSINAVRYNGVFNALTTIYQREGYRRLLRGMSAMVAGAGPAHAMYFACYEKVKHHITLYANAGSKNSNLANGIAGASATLFHDIVMNPAEVVKQRMQMYGSVHKTPIQGIAAILRSEGVFAFYRSFPTQLLMNIPFQTVHFVVYERTQEEFNPTRVYNPVTHMASGALAGAFAAFITNPLDVCRTLLNTQELLHKDMQISGLREAVSTVFRAAGFKTFFRGVTARVLYQMPSTAISWSVYELFKHLLYPHDTSARDDSTPSNVGNQTNTPNPRDISFQTTPVCAAPSRSDTVVALRYKDT